MHDLITETDEALVDAVKVALEALGFDLAVLLIQRAQSQLVDASARLRHRRRNSRSRPRVLRRRRGLLVDGGQVARRRGDVLVAEELLQVPERAAVGEVAERVPVPRRVRKNINVDELDSGAGFEVTPQMRQLLERAYDAGSFESAAAPIAPGDPAAAEREASEVAVAATAGLAQPEGRSWS